jgi:hypothetical protein
VYLGFDSSIPPGFQQLILDELIRFSTLVDYRRIGSDGAAAIFDLRQIPAVDAVDGARMQWYGQRPGQAIEGCVGIAVAERW